MDRLSSYEETVIALGREYQRLPSLRDYLTWEYLLFSGVMCLPIIITWILVEVF